MPSEPSPPIATTASMRFFLQARMISPLRSTVFTLPSFCTTGNSRGLPLFVVPRMVPPRCVMPRTDSSVSGISPPSGYCSGMSSPL